MSISPFSPYPPAKDLFLWLRERWGEQRTRSAREQLDKSITGFRNPRLYDFLEWRYGHEPILVRASRRYPVAVYVAPTTQVGDVDSVLGSLRRGPASAHVYQLRDAAYRRYRQRVGALKDPLLNRPTFTMRDLVTKGTLRIDCGIGTYFDALDSCDSLEWEILSHTPGLKRSDERAFRRFDLGLQHRRDLHYLVQDPIRSGAYRSVAVAVSTLVAYETSDSIRLMIKHRSSRGVAVHSDLTHVIPSFMFQPATGDLLREYSIRHNIYREYLEELFDRPEPEPGALSAIYFYKERTCGIC